MDFHISPHELVMFRMYGAGAMEGAVPNLHGSAIRIPDEKNRSALRDAQMVKRKFWSNLLCCCKKQSHFTLSRLCLGLTPILHYPTLHMVHSPTLQHAAPASTPHT